MPKKLDELTEMQISALQEAGNIGSAHAALALSQLIGHRIMVAVTKISILDLANFTEALGGGEKPIVGVYCRVLGDAEGAILLTFDKEGSAALADVLLGQRIGTTKLLGELEQSAVKEAGSILSASYVNVLADLMKATLIISVPHMSFDKVGVVLQTVFERFLKETDVFVGIETEFIEASARIKGYFLYMPNAAALGALFKALQV